jgi:hypothetical protein
MARKVYIGGKIAMIAGLFVCAGIANLLVLHFMAQDLEVNSSSGALLHLQSNQRLELASNAIVYPSFSGDRSVAALSLALRELGFRTHFCARNLERCMANHLRTNRKDLIWLKQEGDARPTDFPPSDASINILEQSWHIWSRRSLCLAANSSPERSGTATQAEPWHPQCLPLPASPGKLSSLLRDTPGATWVLHRARAADVVLSSDAALDPRASGVLERYLDAPLTVEGRKVSLLVYVAVTSLLPVRFYVYGDAEVHRAARPYTDDPALLNDPDVHRTRHAQVPLPPPCSCGTWRIRPPPNHPRASAFVRAGVALICVGGGPMRTLPFSVFKHPFRLIYAGGGPMRALSFSVCE